MTTSNPQESMASGGDNRVGVRRDDNTSSEGTGTSGSARARVEQTLSGVGQRLEEAKNTVGQRIDRLADSVRERAPEAGVLHNTATTVADRLHSASTYLNENELKEIGKEVTGLMRRYPMVSIAAAFGTGLLVGRPLFSSRKN